MGSVPADGDERREALFGVCRSLSPDLKAGRSAWEIASEAVRLLEDDPLFNAGTGGVLQMDGGARLSASIMNGSRERFSSVSLVSQVKNPSLLAAALQDRTYRNVGPFGSQLLARELGIKPESPLHERSVLRWVEGFKKGFEPGFGTVGAVVRDNAGNLAAATSTGGRGGEFPERMSDSSTPAGNYASRHAAISCSGAGEEILEAGLSVRLETRVRDGGSLEDASRRCLEETVSRKQSFGWISLDRENGWSVAWSTDYASAAVYAGDELLFIPDLETQAESAVS